MSAQERIKSLVKSALPPSVVAALRRRGRMKLIASRRPPSRCFGLDRGGTPIDRHYIDLFFSEHSRDIRGRVLEIGDRRYSMQFGEDRVNQSDVLHVDASHAEATIVGDLVSGRGIPDSAFDCFICTQTLMFTYDVRAAIASIHRSLRPGGAALVTMAGISHICRFDMDHWGDYWRFTSMAARTLFSDAFGAANVTVKPFGNSFAAICLLQGLTAEELSADEIHDADRDYEVIVAVRAIKASSAEGGR